MASTESDYDYKEKSSTPSPNTDTETGAADINVREADIDLKTGDLSEYTVVAEGEERTTLFVWLLVLCCGISGLLFGM